MEKQELVVQSENEGPLLTRAERLVGAAARAVIDSDETAAKGTDLAKMIRVHVSKAEAERKEIVGPFNKGLKAINARFKRMTQPMEEARRTIDGKVLAYHQQVRAIREKEAAEKRRKEKEEADRLAEIARQKDEEEGKTTVKPAEVLPAAPTIPPAPKSKPIRTGVATSSIKKRWTYRVEDIKRLAEHNPHLVLENKVEINRLISSGARTISGLDIYEEESLQVR